MDVRLLSCWYLCVVALASLTAACSSAPESAASRAQSGLLKADRLARNVPFTDADLADHFQRVAFGAEYTIRDGRYVVLRQRSDTPLKRWSDGLAYRIHGAATPADQQQITDMAARLARVSGLFIAEAPPGTSASLDIRFLGPDGRAETAAEFRDAPKQNPLAELFQAWASTPDWPCASEFYYQRTIDPKPFQIEYAVIYIRGELTGISRQACIEEEMSQSLGLARDDPAVRPSIFNDDDEYALLTTHDEYLLRILYDARLAPGMTRQQTMPMVPDIIATIRAAE